MRAIIEKTLHLKTLIAKIKILFDQWRKTPKVRTQRQKQPAYYKQQSSRLLPFNYRVRTTRKGTLRAL